MQAGNLSHSRDLHPCNLVPRFPFANVAVLFLSNKFLKMKEVCFFLKFPMTIFISKFYLGCFKNKKKSFSWLYTFQTAPI